MSFDLVLSDVFHMVKLAWSLGFEEGRYPLLQKKKKKVKLLLNILYFGSLTLLYLWLRVIGNRFSLSHLSLCCQEHCLYSILETLLHWVFFQITGPFLQGSKLSLSWLYWKALGNDSKVTTVPSQCKMLLIVKCIWDFKNWDQGGYKP